MALDAKLGWWVGRGIRVLLLAALIVIILGMGGAMSRAQAEQESPYKVSEFAIRVAPKGQYNAIVSGQWVVWRDQDGGQRRISGRNMETGVEFSFDTAAYAEGSLDIDGDVVVTAESEPELGYGIFGYRLPDGQRFIVAPSKTEGTGFSRKMPRIGGNTVVWAEGIGIAPDIYGYDLAAQRLFAICTNPASQEWPAVSGSVVVWRDNRHSPPAVAGQPISELSDLYGYDLSTGQEFRITAKTEEIGPPQISGNVIVWSVRRGDDIHVVGYDISRREEFALAQLPLPLAGLLALDIDGHVVVWSSSGESGDDIFAYDLKQRKQFIISRAIGAQIDPRVSGNTVVWTDARHSGVGKYEYDVDVYGARLEPGPAPWPPAIGAPTAADAKIEIVWPHGGVLVTEASKANIGTWLFLPGTLNIVPCQWNPKVQLWRALNNEPARMIAQGRKQGDHYYVGGRAVPSWEFNDIDVSAARDPRNKLYFFVTLDGVPSHTNVWSHGADARTYFPQQDVVAGVTPVSGAVEAKIEIVWPHDNAPVQRARLVNISASLFSPGTLLSVPPDWSPSVRLYRALNNDVGQEVATGVKRLIQRGGFNYPVWDFNDVDVSAANDPVNKYYFTLKVDGVATHTNVWAHGADARTYFPQMDTPTQGCQ